jgi:hypothetical protein
MTETVTRRRSPDAHERAADAPYTGVRYKPRPRKPDARKVAALRAFAEGRTTKAQSLRELAEWLGEYMNWAENR